MASNFLAGLSGATKGFADVVVPELIRRKRKQEADEEKKKRNEQIIKAYNTLQNQGQPMPTDDIRKVNQWVADQNAIPEAEATLLNADFPLSSVLEQRKAAEKKKRFTETIAKLPEDFRKTIEPFAPILEDDPEAVLKMYADHVKQSGKTPDAESLKMLGMSEGQFRALNVAKELGGAEFAASAAERMGIKSQDTGKDPVWLQKKKLVDSIALDKNGKLKPWGSLTDEEKMQLSFVDVNEDNYLGASKIRGIKISEFNSISNQISKPFIGFEASITPQGQSFLRWVAGKEGKTPEQKELDAQTFPYFEGTFTKEGTVKPEAVKRRYDAITGVADLSDQRADVQQFYLLAKSRGYTAESLQQEYDLAKKAGDTTFTDSEWKKMIERLRTDG